MRQQQQIEANQQLLLAKEKRLKHLRQQDDVKRQPQPSVNNDLKIIKLKQLRHQIIEQKTSNSNMYSELDLIKLLFQNKENELHEAISKVSELAEQIDQLRFIKTTSSLPLSQIASNTGANCATDIDKLKQELHIRNRINEQQSAKILQQQNIYKQKQFELLQLDKRIDDLKLRIKNKRSMTQQIQIQFEATPNDNVDNSRGKQNGVDVNASKPIMNVASIKQVANTVTLHQQQVCPNILHQKAVSYQIVLASQGPICNNSLVFGGSHRSLFYIFILIIAYLS
jgi:hypothetical protein